MVVFALSCFGLLLFLWLSFGGPVPLKPKGYRVTDRLPGGDDAGPGGRRARRRRAGRQGPHGRGRGRHQPDRRHGRDRAPLRAAALGRPRDPAPEDAARRDLRGADAGHVEEDDPRGREAARGPGQADRPARRDLRLARPRDARRLQGLADRAGEGHPGPRARLQRRPRHTAGLRLRRRRRARGARHAGGRGPAPRQEHRRRLRRADAERGAAAQPDHGLQAARSTRRPPRTTSWRRRSGSSRRS